LAWPGPARVFLRGFTVARFPAINPAPGEDRGVYIQYSKYNTSNI
jgi:hypothetical protein